MFSSAAVNILHDEIPGSHFQSLSIVKYWLMGSVGNTELLYTRKRTVQGAKIQRQCYLFFSSEKSVH